MYVMASGEKNSIRCWFLDWLNILHHNTAYYLAHALIKCLGFFHQYVSQEEYLLLKETTNDYLNHQKMISAVKLITLKY